MAPGLGASRISNCCRYSLALALTLAIELEPTPGTSVVGEEEGRALLLLLSINPLPCAAAAPPEAPEGSRSSPRPRSEGRGGVGARLARRAPAALADVSGETPETGEARLPRLLPSGRFSTSPSGPSECKSSSSLRANCCASGLRPRPNSSSYLGTRWPLPQGSPDEDAPPEITLLPPPDRPKGSPLAFPFRLW